MDVASKSEWCFSGALSSVTALFSDKITLSVRQCQECLQPISHSAIQQKIWRSCHNIYSVTFTSPSSSCTTSVRVSNSSNTNNLCSWDRQLKLSKKPQPRCMWNRTLFEQNTFDNNIKWHLSSGVNDYQVKLRRKPRLPLLHAGQQTRTTTRNSLEERQQDKRDHSRLGHHEISHCSSFIYKTLTNIKQGEQTSNTINLDYTYGLKSPCPCASARRDCPSREDGAAPYRLSQLSWEISPRLLHLWTRRPCQLNGTASKPQQKTPSPWLRKWGQMRKTDH